MTKKERIEKTIALQEVDRIPIYDLLRNDIAFEYFSGERIPYPLTENKKTEEKLMTIVGKAVNEFLDMTRSVGFGPIIDKEETTEDGFVYKYSAKSKTAWIEKRPFNDEKEAIEWLKKNILCLKENLKKLKTDRNYSNFKKEEHIKQFYKIQEKIGNTINLYIEQGIGLDNVRHGLGFELFSYIQADNPELISEFLEISTQYNISFCHIIAKEPLPSVSVPIVLTYGDIAGKNRLLHSPEFLRKEFFPRLKKLNDAWHEHDFKCLFHSDGYLMDIMDDLIEAGIDGLNPIETVAGMNLKEIKQQYGKKIFLTGGIDMSQLMATGTPEEVRESCKNAIKDAYPGYFIGSTTETDNSVKIENIIALYEVATNFKP